MSLARSPVLAVCLAFNFSCTPSSNVNGGAPGGSKAGASSSEGGGGARAGGGGTTAGGVGGESPSGGGGGAVYATPEWADLGTRAGCRFEKLANAASIKPLVSWAACASVAGCDDGTLHAEHMMRGGRVMTMGLHYGVGTLEGSPAVAFTLVGAADNRTEAVAVVMAEGGNVLQAFRAIPLAESTCGAASASISAPRFGFSFREITDAGMTNSLIVGDLTGAADLVPIEVDFRFSRLQRTVIGDGRFVGFAEFANAVIGMDLAGGPVEVVGPVSPPEKLRNTSPESFGSFFTYDVAVGEATHTSSYIARTDGVTEGTPYITEPDASFGAARDAGGLIGYQKAIGLTDQGKYETVELWSTPKTVPPNPSRVATLAVNGLIQASGMTVGGANHYAAVIDDKVLVWNLASGDQWECSPLPETGSGGLVGISENHVWTGVRSTPTGLADGFRRCRLK